MLFLHIFNFQTWTTKILDGPGNNKLALENRCSNFDMFWWLFSTFKQALFFFLLSLLACCSLKCMHKSIHSFFPFILCTCIELLSVFIHCHEYWSRTSLAGCIYIYIHLFTFSFRTCASVVVSLWVISNYWLAFDAPEQKRLWILGDNLSWRWLRIMQYSYCHRVTFFSQVCFVMAPNLQIRSA